MTEYKIPRNPLVPIMHKKKQGAHKDKKKQIARRNKYPSDYYKK